MARIKRATVNLPDALLREATALTGAGITETIIQGLELIRRSKAYDTARSLKGKLNLTIDLDASRERSHR